MKNISIIISILAFFIGGAAYAQNTVSGTIRDPKGEAVIGAAVILEGSSSIGTTTDLDGKYILTIPSGTKSPVLKIASIGFVTKNEPVSGRTVIDIILEEDRELLDEAVVVGYGSMRKSDLTGSVASVRIDEADAAKSSSLSNLLQGHAAGVQVVSNSAGPDSGVSIKVRGASSFNGSNEPLYVVDGVILNPTGMSESILTIGSDNEGTDESVNSLMGINPQDIASIEILKDASATAIYGALGANGVVLITTKSATKDKPVIRFSAGIDISTRYKKMGILSFDEYVTYLELQKEAGLSTEGILGKIYDDPSTHSGLKVKPMDWQDYAFRTAIGQRYFFSVSGRPKTMAYTFSIGYNDKDGIVRTTGIKVLTMRLNIDKNFSDKIKIGTKTNVAYINSKQGQSSGKATAATSLIRSILSFRPYSTVLEDEDDESYDEDNNLRSGPDRWLKDFVNNRREIRITPSMYVQYKFAEGFSFKSTIGGDLRDSERIKFKSSRINSTTEGSTGAVANFRYFNWNWDNTLSYKMKKGGHSLNLMAGSSANSFNSTVRSDQGWNIIQYRGLDKSISGAPNAGISYTESHNSALSFLTRGVYNFKDRYVLTATYRVDGSSKFQGANKWSSFPSVAFAWRINEEPWFNSRLISQTKLRFGWGRVGNQAISNYQTLSNYTNSQYSDHSTQAGYSVGIVPSNIANPNLKWETTEQVNAGLDFSMFQGRLAFSADAYRKVTYDLLQTKHIASSSGFSTMWVNEGTIQNLGLEFTLDATPVKTKDFEWNLNGNISFNRGKILALNSDAEKNTVYLDENTPIEVQYITGSGVGSSNYANAPLGIFMVGYPMGLFYGYKTDGIVQEDEIPGPPVVDGGEPAGPGHIRFVDTNGNGYADPNDRMIIGNPNPEFTFGFGTTFSFRNFTLSASFNGSYGNSIINVNNMRESDTAQLNHNVLRRAVFDSWTPDNPGAKYWGIGMINSTECRAIKDVDIEDGSYLRLSSLTLSYDFPINRKKSRILKGLNLGVSGGNLWILTKYSGWDPEVNSYGTDIMKMGADSGSYPSARTFSFDVKLTF